MLLSQVKTVSTSFYNIIKFFTIVITSLTGGINYINFFPRTANVVLPRL